MGQEPEKANLTLALPAFMTLGKSLTSCFIKFNIKSWGWTGWSLIYSSMAKFFLMTPGAKQKMNKGLIWRKRKRNKKVKGVEQKTKLFCGGKLHM